MASSLFVHFVAMQNMYLTRQLTCQLPAQCFLNTDVETRQEHESFSLEKPLIYQAHTEESLSVPNRWKLSSIVVVLHVSWRVRKSTQRIILLAARMQTYIFHKVGNFKDRNAYKFQEIWVQLFFSRGCLLDKQEDWGKGQSRSVPKQPIKTRNNIT